MKSRTSALAITLCACFALSACGGEAPRDGERGATAFPRGLAKADGTLSCVDSCGAQAPGGCWCDPNCAAYGDCCADRAEICGTVTPAPPCLGFCGGKSDQGCWCDAGCAAYGDCCPDIAQTCSPPAPEPVPAPEPCNGICTYNAHCADYCPQGASCMQVLDDGPAYWLILGC